MMNLADIQQNTPRLVVEFTRPEPDKERFRWGIVGSMPVLTLVGYIVRVQAELAFRKPEECGAMALIVVWDAEALQFSYFVNPAIPVDSLVGMLETIKISLIGSASGSAQPDNQKVGIFGADGQPLHQRG